MASRNTNRKRPETRPGPQKRYPPRPAIDGDAPPDVVDPRWLLKAFALAIGAAAVLGYLSVCLLVYLGGWQLMLHPQSQAHAEPAVPYQALRFDAGATGSPRLNGWWIPADSATPTTPTMLYLHDGSGTMDAAAPKLNLLHRSEVNIFAFDYRGYGQSAGPHPTEQRMLEDAAAALEYLTETRHLPAATIVPYGEGLGAVLAAELVNAHPELPALVVDNPDPEAFDRATGSGKAHLLPMRMLVQDRFDLRAALVESKKPKLLLADGPFGFVSARVRKNEELFRQVSGPKTVVSFARVGSDDDYTQALKRFLDEYLPR